MEKPQNRKRQEKKYIISNSAANKLEKHLTSLGFYIHHKTNVVNNVYLDDQKFNSMKENINGDEVRSKYRIRWYDYENEFTLEEKIKQSSSGSKKKQKLVATDLNEAIHMACVITKKYPVIQNSYIRRYYIKGKTRITLDRDLKFKIPLAESSKNFNKVIVEVKYDTSVMFNTEDYLIREMQLTKFSKYLEGLKVCGIIPISV
jgi:hypothetical protein